MQRRRGASTPTSRALNARLERIAEMAATPGTDPREVYAATIAWEQQARAARTYPRPRTTSTSTPRRTRESRRERPGRRRTRRASSAARSPDDSGPAEPPPPLPWRIAGTATDTRDLERAFISILTRRDPDVRWAIGTRP